MSGAFIEIRNAAVAYGERTALEVRALSVHKGETLSLVGHNGSGKSTLLKLMGLLIAPARGEVWFEGERVVHEPRRLLALRRRTANVMQDPLLVRMSVFNNVAVGLRFRGVPSQDIRKRVNTWLDRLRITPLRDRPAGALSGGEAQRTSLARALILSPELLLLDEPFGALDPPTREGLLVDLREILAETRTTTVFATHDRGEALALGDRVAVLSGGRVAQLGAPDEIFAQPATE
ncbi:MAG: ABC transporter ATP-binding protein, partial [Myxococcota bacterium]